MGKDTGVFPSGLMVAATLGFSMLLIDPTLFCTRYNWTSSYNDAVYFKRMTNL